jgi:sporulation protein YlmC with PRC-barrel domain
MTTSEVHVELLVGRRVFAANGRSVGRLEEIRVELSAGSAVVVEYFVGEYALLSRLAALSIGRLVLRILHSTPKKRGYKIPWDKLDLSDPEKLLLLCSVDELDPIGDEEIL